MKVKDNKNICIVTPSFNGGGAERIAVNLANYYSETGKTVSIIAFNSVGPYFEQVSDKVKVIDLKSRARYVFFKLYNALRVQRPEVVISVMRDSNIFVGFSAYFLKTKIIFREANTMDSIVSMPSIKRWVYVFLMRQSYKRADKIIANSNDTRHDLLKNKAVHSEKIYVIENPAFTADFERLVKEKINHKWLGVSKYKSILNVGRLHRQKNQALLVRAFSLVYAKFVNARLVILGEGREKENLISIIKDMGLDEVVEIIPFKQNPYPYYKAASVFVLTSDWEGFGNVIVEAMASGTPVISTDCPGGPKMILNNGEFGRLVVLNNQEKLAEEIVKELEGPTIDLEIKKAKQRAREFSIENIAQRYLKL
jgi:glycosyltransferase involved in cell wall biosynthesis